MEIWIVVAAVIVALAVIIAFCAIVFKLLNIIHDMTYVEPVVEQGGARRTGAHKKVIEEITIMASVRRGW